MADGDSRVAAASPAQHRSEAPRGGPISRARLLVVLLVHVHAPDVVALAEEVELWTALQPAPVAGPQVCPWRGLASYSEADAPWFAGRERITAELRARRSDDSRFGSCTEVSAEAWAELSAANCCVPSWFRSWVVRLAIWAVVSAATCAEVSTPM